MENKVAMPVQVRIFWWLSVVIVIYSIVLTVLAVQHIRYTDYLLTIAKVPPGIRERTYRMDVSVHIVSAAVWCGLILLLAWLAAFRRLNLARWVLAFLFSIWGLYEFWGAVEFHELNAPVLDLIKKGWWAYILLTFAVAAVSCVFSSRAQVWFERAP